MREHIIELDLRERIPRHNCDDWRKGLAVKRLCKHVAKPSLVLPLEVSEKILKDTIENMESWRFETTEA